MIIDEVCDDLMDDLCNFCEKTIIPEVKGPPPWVCEGCFCEEAEPRFYEEDPIGIRYYRKKKLLKINKNKNEKNI